MNNKVDYNYFIEAIGQTEAVIESEALSLIENNKDTKPDNEESSKLNNFIVPKSPVKAKTSPSKSNNS